MKPVTEYTDFRAYLSEWIGERKVQGLPGSNRWFAMKMGINSTSWLTSVVKGVKGLSKATANKLSEILKHSPVEARYFETLVCFNQARTIVERNRYYQELGALQKLKDVRIVKATQYELYSTWYHSAVRSLVGMHPFRADSKDYERLGALVLPPITASQARKSVELLVDLGFIKLNDNGVFELTVSAVASGENTRSLGVANFQQETMRLAQEALDRFAAGERYIGTATVGVSEAAFLKIKKLLADASDKIAEIANADPDANRVYQVNFQAFPLSAAAGKDGKDVGNPRKPHGQGS
jgi:uncharacterized protein (TIGR02147 family)